MDETGVQSKNTLGYVIAQIRFKNNADNVTSEKGVTVISVCNAEGSFLQR